jgi:hypothetical protein
MEVVCMPLQKIDLLVALRLLLELLTADPLTLKVAVQVHASEPISKVLA